jgi:hypothetical protein
MRAGDTTGQAEQMQIEALRRMGPEGRLRVSLDLARTSRELLLEGIRKRHPEFDENKIKMEYIRLVLPRDLFLAAYPEAPNVLP